MTKKIFFILYILAACVHSAGTLSADVVDRIVVAVNDEVITQGEIDRMVAPVYEQYRSIYSGETLTKKLNEAVQRVVQQLIDDRLLFSEAKRLNIEVSDKEVEARIDDAEKRMGSKEKFNLAMADQRMTLKDVRERFREQIMVRKLIDQKVGGKIAITPIEVSDYYAAHINEYIVPEQIKLRNILIKPKPDTEILETLKLVKDIQDRIREGGDFAALAKIYSQGPNAAEGGMMDAVKKGDLLPEVEKVVYNLQPGQYSTAIQTSMGYFIFKVEEKMTQRTYSQSEVRRDIEEAIYREKSREKVKAWIDSLRKNAYIAFR
jgi:peptidyl-prolyl cis-trans isomerase SurA